MQLKYTVLLFLMVLAAMSYSQSTSKVYFTGLGRALVTHDALDGAILQNDTATPNRGTEGYALFDMGVNFQPYEYLRAKAIFRLKNKFGSFYGQGASVEFRQVLIEGIIAKKVKYAIGDMDVQMTPYTVFNSVDSSNAFESEVFKIRRDIVHYENFNVGNNWRVQGAKASAVMLIKKKPTRIKLDLFAARTRATNYSNLPDRFLCGTSVNAFVFKGFNAGLNYVRFFELDNQTKSQTTSYGNDVVTGTLSYEWNTSDVLFRLKGEGGVSFFHRTIAVDTSLSKNDYFFDGRGEVEIKSTGIKLYGGYREVGPQFYSPSSQTLRIDVTKAPAIFPMVQNNTVTREQLLYDRTTQEALYNQTILPTLMAYLPQYGNALPYGEATPNRKGFVFGATAGGKDRLVNASARADILTEIIGEGTASLRHFFLLRAGTFLNLHKAIQSNRLLILSLGGKIENTSRQAPAEVSLKTQQFDLGLTVETIKNFDLILGAKSLFSKGNEFLAVRNSFNEIVDYNVVTLDFAQQTWSGGIRYRFSDKSFFTLQGNYTDNKNKLENGAWAYQFSQFFVTYQMAF
jgi:hypothetical protein